MITLVTGGSRGLGRNTALSMPATAAASRTGAAVKTRRPLSRRSRRIEVSGGQGI
jgi:NAD(P)-dependent dehydrogenase (short-subunit alcohol dehydrogenase family)